MPDEPPSMPDRFGAVFPDGAVYDATEGARLFDQDAEQRARAMAVKIGGRPVRIRTTIEWLPGHCAACGFADIFYDPADGWCCRACHRTDADE